MIPTRPGNEPDPGDMSTEPNETGDVPVAPDLPDEEAEKLGDLA